MSKADGKIVNEFNSNLLLVFFLLHLSQVKKNYLEACITTQTDPDLKFLQILQQSESQPQSYQRLDLSSTQDLPNILKLFENEKHVNQIQVKDSQLIKHKKQFEEFQSRNCKIAIKVKNTKIEFKEDLKSKQPIPALDLNQISASINSKSSTKSNRQYSSHQKNYSCKNLKNLQQFFTDRISGHLSSSKETDRKISSISPNTKTINLNLTQKNPLNQVLSVAPNFSKKTFFSQKKKEPYFIDFLGRQEFQTSRNYLKKMNSTNSTVFNKTQSITMEPDKKKLANKQTPTGSFIDQFKKSSVHKEQISGVFKEEKKQECQSMHIPVKFLLESNPPLMKMDSDRFKVHLSNRQNSKDFKKDKMESSRENSFKKQLNSIVQNSDRNGFYAQKQQQVEETVQNEDISIHLKNLINFCNQSIQKKEQTVVQDSQEISKKYLISQKENLKIDFSKKNQQQLQHQGQGALPSKVVGSVEIKTLNLKNDEDTGENPETARFNQEESEFKKLNEVINFKKNGHQTDRHEPYFPIEQLAELKKIVKANFRTLIYNIQYSSRGLQKLFEQKSKSVSPTNANSEQAKNSFFEMMNNDDFINQLQGYKIKKNLKGQQVKIGRLQISNMNLDKQSEKGMKEMCQQLQGLKIENDSQDQLSIPLMKAVLDNQLQYLCLANCNISQNELCLSLVFLEYLDISGNKLVNLSIAKNCSNLQEIQASNNQINNLEGLGMLKQLKILDLQGNKIQSFETLLSLKQNENIEAINLFDNAVAKYPNYKRFLQQILQKIDNIDNSDYVKKYSQSILNQHHTHKYLFDTQTSKPINKRYYQYEEYQQLKQKLN